MVANMKRREAFFNDPKYKVDETPTPDLQDWGLI